MKNINYKQLKRYDVGKQIISNGYQGSTQTILPTGYVDKPITTMDNSISGQNLQTFTDAVSRISSYGSIFSNSNFKPLSNFGAAQQNVNNAISSGLTTSEGLFTQKGAEAAFNAGFKEAGSGLAAGKAGTEAALKGSGQSIAKTGLSGAGKVVAGVGAAYGAFNTAKDIAGFYTDRISSADIQNQSGTSINYFGNVPYKQYTGFDAEGNKQYTDKQNTSDTIKTSLDAAGTGASIGAFWGPSRMW